MKMEIKHEIRGHILSLQEDEETGNVYLKVRVFRPHYPRPLGNSEDDILGHEPTTQEKTEHHKKVTKHNREMATLKKLHLGGITLQQVEAKE